LNRYDRELRRPSPSEPQFAPDSNVWRREHALAGAAEAPASVRDKVRPPAADRARSLEIYRPQEKEFLRIIAKE